MSWLRRFSWILLFLFIPLASAIVCEDNIKPLDVCKVVTPVVSCSSLNYSVYNDNFLIDNGSLSSYTAPSVYYFNFSQDIGEYLLVLCDGSTRTLYVNYYNLDVFGESFNWLAIVLIFITISLISLWISRKITNNDLFLFKNLLFFFGLINSFVMVSLTVFISSGAIISNFNSYFNVYVEIVVLLSGLFILYYGVYYVKQMWDLARKGGNNGQV